VEEHAAFYRRMLAEPPHDVAEGISYRNGTDLFAAP